MNRLAWPLRSDSRLLRWFTLISTAWVAVICLIEIWPSDRWWVTAPLTWAPQIQWAVAPSLLVLWSVLARDMRRAAMNAAAVAFVVLGPVGLEIEGPEAPGGEMIVAVTHNLQGRVEMTPKLRDHWLDRCDVLCLQEAAAQGFARLLTLEDGYDQTSVGDVRTFVRGRIVRSEVVGPAEGTNRKFLAAHADIRGQRVAILNVHFATNVQNPVLSRSPAGLSNYLHGAVTVRGRQQRLVEDWLRRQRCPTLVLGDFNIPPPSACHHRLARRAVDAFAAVGNGLGYTYLVRDTVPVMRIDYVWCARGLIPVSCTTGGEWASDHRWVEATIRLPSQTPGE